MWQSIASIYAHFLMHAFSMSIRCKEAVLVCMHVHVCIICLMRSVISDHSTSCIQHYLNCCQQYYYHIVLCAAHFGLLMAAILNSAVARVWLSFYCCAITNKVASCCFSQCHIWRLNLFVLHTVVNCCLICLPLAGFCICDIRPKCDVWLQYVFMLVHVICTIICKCKCMIL